MTLLAGVVSGVASTFSLDNNTLYKARSFKDRWLDSYRLAEELQFTGGGATATDAAVLQGLFNRAKAAGRGEIILPRGDIALEAAVSIFEPGTQPIRIVGQGPNQTRLKNTAAAQKFFNIGDAAQARTKDMTLEGFQLYAAVAQDSAGRGFNLRNTSDISFKDILVDSLKNGWALGEGASASNDAVYTSLVNCGGESRRILFSAYHPGIGCCAFDQRWCLSLERKQRSHIHPSVRCIMELGWRVRFQSGVRSVR